MGTRTEIIKMSRYLSDIDINIEFIKKDISNFVTYINLSDYNLFNSYIAVHNSIKSKEILFNIIYKILSKINPDINIYIYDEEYSKDNNGIEKKLYTHLAINLALRIEEIKELENKTIGRIRTSDLQVLSLETSWITSFNSELKGILEDLVINALKESYIQFCNLENPRIIKIKKTKEQDKEVIFNEERYIEKDRDLFWRLVFSYFYNSSRIMVNLFSKQNFISKPSNIIGNIRGNRRYNSYKDNSYEESAESEEAPDDEQLNSLFLQEESNYEL